MAVTLFERSIITRILRSSIIASEHIKSLHQWYVNQMNLNGNTLYLVVRAR